MIDKHPPSQGLNIRIPIISPIKGRGFINHGSTLGHLGTASESRDADLRSFYFWILGTARICSEA